MGEKIKYLLFFMLVLILALPLLQWIFHIPQPSLKGVVAEDAVVSFNAENWFEGKWQDNYTTHYEHSFGFRSHLVRLCNQVEFSLFHRTRSWCVIGKDDYLYEAQYITAYKGDDFAGTDTIREQARKLDVVAEKLRMRGKQLFVVLAPGKADIFPEYIPDSYEPWIRNISNHDAWGRMLPQTKVPFINFNSIFKNLKGHTDYPLYTPYGIHWSEYAAAVSADSIAGFLAKLSGHNLSRLRFDSTYYDTDRLESDGDLMLLMNMIWPIRKTAFPYPVLSQRDTLAYKPRMITIADSYYWTIISSGAASVLFDTASTYWYYNNTEYAHLRTGDVPKTDVLKKILDYDYVMLLYNVPNCSHLGNGIINQLYDELAAEEAQKRTVSSNTKK